jgi:hypothetical protein
MSSYPYTVPTQLELKLHPGGIRTDDLTFQNFRREGGNEAAEDEDKIEAEAEVVNIYNVEEEDNKGKLVRSED